MNMKYSSKKGGTLGESCTFKPLKSHSFRQKQFFDSHINGALNDTSSLINATVRPNDEISKEEWVAMNILEFYNDLSLIWGMLVDDLGEQEEGEGFPEGFEYRWVQYRRRSSSTGSAGSRSCDPGKWQSPSSSSSKKKKVIRCSAKDYVNFAMDWIDDEIENISLLSFEAPSSKPTGSSCVYSSSEADKCSGFLEVIRDIFKKMFRIYAIIYAGHLRALEELELLTHVNTAFKHFLFFMWEHDLVSDVREFIPVGTLVETFREKFTLGRVEKENLSNQV